ncbi:hypothetical protein HYQ44_012179 [Verticillium longisporum]|nr:hypothetical protein HYQ44_012179 [Verticillium longisporum]
MAELQLKRLIVEVLFRRGQSEVSGFCTLFRLLCLQAPVHGCLTKEHRQPADIKCDSPPSLQHEDSTDHDLPHLQGAEVGL